MHIFYTRGSGDPMLLDTKEGLHSLGAQLRSFLESSAEVAEFAASTEGSPEPYSEFLAGLRLIKSNEMVRLSLETDRWLVLAAGKEELERCVGKFLLEEEDGHTHLYAKPMSLIIEADSTWNQAR
jgi:hypothetical protein